MTSEWMAIALAEAGTTIKALEAERDALKVKLDTQQIVANLVAALIDERDALKADVERLREALKPFADFAVHRAIEGGPRRNSTAPRMEWRSVAATSIVPASPSPSSSESQEHKCQIFSIPMPLNT